MPGREGAYCKDIAAIIGWGPALVLTMATTAELTANGASGIGADLGAQGVEWRHLPVPDFGSDSAALQGGWGGASADALTILRHGGRVLAHCMGGCGRSGMALLRLMVEAGEAPDAALGRLRAARPCAVETEAQRLWAVAPAGCF
ncbi:MAG: protein phosphatase [Rhodobacteraceae bacterium]|nr:protein phosphatase [Paracoccaceae bacterium]